MDPQQQELFQVLDALVVELKQGINEYSTYLQNNPQTPSRSFLEKAIKDMHQIGIKLNIGKEALHELEALKHRLTNQEQRQ